jgi:hypothetical protein
MSELQPSTAQPTSQLINHQQPTFHSLGDFLNPALALLGQGFKKSPIGQKLDFANHPYLCKGFTVLKIKPSNNS